MPIFLPSRRKFREVGDVWLCRYCYCSRYSSHTWWQNLNPRWLVSFNSFAIGKGLTFSKDWIYAIHGIACLIIERLKVKHFNGAFRPYLAQGLAWSHPLRGPYNALPDESVDPRDDRFPTWCWASNGPVQFSDILVILQTGYHISLHKRKTANDLASCRSIHLPRSTVHRSTHKSYCW